MKKTLRFATAFAALAVTVLVYGFGGSATAQTPRGGHNGSMLNTPHPRTGQPVAVNNSRDDNYRPQRPAATPAQYRHANGQGHGHGHGHGHYAAPAPAVCYPATTPSYYSTCHAPVRHWVPGYWRNTHYGQRVWVTGHWRVRNGAAYTVVYDPAPVQVVSYQPTMGYNEFLNAMGYLRSLSFETTRTQAARQMLDNHLFTSEQVREMVSTFSFESSRLEIAQYAYLRTIDPQNFYTVYSAFSFESSVVALDNYISRM